jgi:cytochrome b561
MWRSSLSKPNFEDIAVTFHHDRATIFFHWAVAALVLATFLLGLNIDDFARGAPRVDARSTHFALGICLALVLIARGMWRKSEKASRAPLEKSKITRWSKAAMHAVLYWGAFVVIALGMFNAWARGDSIFNYFSLRTVDPHDTFLRDFSEPVHMYAAYTLVGLAAAHSVAAIVAHYLGNGGLIRMLPMKRKMA